MNIRQGLQKISFILLLISNVSIGSLFQVYAQVDNGGQQQGTFDFGSQQDTTNEGTPTVTGTVPLPTSPPIVGDGSQPGCRPPTSDLGPIYTLSGMHFGWASYAIWGKETRRAKGGYWYYIPETVVQDNVLQANLQNIIRRLEGQNLEANAAASTPSPFPTFTSQKADSTDYGQKQGTFDVAPVITIPIVEGTTNLGDLKIRQEAKIIKDIMTIGEACPLRLTGASPTLFLYAPADSEYAVQTEADITYADPAFENNIWNVMVHENNTLTVNGSPRSFIYYEYMPREFLKPTEGWVINKNFLNQFKQNVLESALGLSPLEAERGLFELHHAADSINSQIIFIGLIPQEEVNKKLPITITPDPQSVYRLHFYITRATDGENPAAPILYPIVRTANMALELGSYAKK